MISDFGTLSDGTPVRRIALKNGMMTACILDYGAVMQSLCYDGTDLVLGYDDPQDYESRSGRMGAVIGRFANRISKGRFVLNGKEHQLTVNRGEDHIHGGNRGFDKRIWDIEKCSDDSVVLHLHSENGEEGYPGEADVRVTYTLTDDSIIIRYEAGSSEDTVMNLTNHSYFNLGGEGTIHDHEVVLNSSYYTETDGNGIPTGQVIPVGNSRLDMRRPVILGNRTVFGGCDMNFLLDSVGKFAKVYCGRTGITMEAFTDMPAVQFYTGHNLKDGISGKYGMTYGKYSGLCLETQFCPDSPNHDNFPSCVLRKGEKYLHTTEYRFGRRVPGSL